MKKVHTDCSFFLDDGTAFGKADIGFERNELPEIGQLISVAEMAKRDASSEVLKRIEATVKFVVKKNILHQMGKGTSEHYFGCYLEDVFFANRELAVAVFRDLESVGFDCDTWDR
jgi:hypothetical protein